MVEEFSRCLFQNVRATCAVKRGVSAPCSTRVLPIACTVIRKTEMILSSLYWGWSSVNDPHKQNCQTITNTKKGYWHVELDDEFSLLTTLNRQFGRNWFLPFGLWMSKNVFQPKLDKCYAGINNISDIADDILVSERVVEKQDKAFKARLDATGKNNIQV